MVYFINFCTSLFFLANGEKQIKRNRLIGQLLIVIGLLIPILLAGLRHTSVGVDVEYYVVPFFARALDREFYGNPLRYASMNNIDICYALLNWVVAFFTDNIQMFLFILEAIIIVFTYLAFRNLSYGKNTWLSMAYYYLLCYNNSLSTVRQSLSMAFIIYGISLIFKNNFSKKSYFFAFIYILVATGFQTGAFIGTLILFVIFAIKKGFGIVRIGSAFLIAFFVLTILRDQIMSFLLSIASIINPKYLTSIIFQGHGLSDNLTSTLICLFVLFVSCLIYWKRHLLTPAYRVLILTSITISLIMTLFYISLSTYQPIVRLMLTLQILWPCVLCKSDVLVRRNNVNLFLINSITLFAITVYWYYMYIAKDMVETANYVLM